MLCYVMLCYILYFHFPVYLSVCCYGPSCLMYTYNTCICDVYITASYRAQRRSKTTQCQNSLVADDRRPLSLPQNQSSRSMTGITSERTLLSFRTAYTAKSKLPTQCYRMTPERQNDRTDAAMEHRSSLFNAIRLATIYRQCGSCAIPVVAAIHRVAVWLFCINVINNIDILPVKALID